MSVLLEYHSLQPVSSDAAARIVEDQRGFLKTRCYWSEPLFLALEQTTPARLVGSNSLFNSGGYETQSGKWMEVSEQEDYLMAWSDTSFIVQKLSDWSRQYGIHWSMYSAGDHIGDIVEGKPDESLGEFLEGLLGGSTLDPEMIPEIDRKFANRCEPPQASSTASAVVPTSKPNKPWWRLW